MYGYINQIDNPIPTGKVWDNETFRLTDCEKGHGHDEIMKTLTRVTLTLMHKVVYLFVLNLGK